ncbi:hypothetical protein [Burkholderia plantarii]|uniref:hypothetical protein n=1 Tax=Burkholderia plantarii TaxID=41899 RepID=UPI000F50D942|nr:hypothetical protein [Burkholderia plantarii]
MMGNFRHTIDLSIGYGRAKPFWHWVLSDPRGLARGGAWLGQDALRIFVTRAEHELRPPPELKYRAQMLRTFCY